MILFGKKVMSNELDTLTKTRTWNLEDLPPEKSELGCKWVYKIKIRVDGSMVRYKTRLGFAHDYHCLYALVALHEPSTYHEASFDPLW